MNGILYMLKVYPAYPHFHFLTSYQCKIIPVFKSSTQGNCF